MPRIMLRTSLRIITLVAVLVIAGLLASCSNNELEGKRYSVEKAYTQARRMVDNYSVKPELRSTDDYYQLVTAYLGVWQKFEKLFPNITAGDSLARPEMEAALYAGRSLMSASGLLLQADQLDSATTILNLILDNNIYPQQQRFDAMLTQGHIAAEQGRWLDAEKLYDQLLKEHYPPFQRDGYPDMSVLNLPSTIVQHYLDADDQAEAEAKANWAIGYYSKLAEDSVRSPVQLVATRKLAEMYAATKQYQKAVNLLETVVDSTGNILDPARAMIADLYVTQLKRPDDAVGIYQDIIEHGTDSISIAMSYIKLATLYIDGSKYQEGRNYIDELKARFPNATQLLAQAQQLKAQSFEKQENYERARQEYVALINEYPTTTQALQTIVYLPEMFDRIKQPALKRQFTERAESKLRELIRDYPNRRIGAQAGSYLGTFLLRNKRYQDAIDQYHQLRQMYPKSSLAGDALIRIGMIYKNNLKNKTAALDAFREFLKQYPNSVVRSQVEKQINQLEKS